MQKFQANPLHMKFCWRKISENERAPVFLVPSRDCCRSRIHNLYHHNGHISLLGFSLEPFRRSNWQHSSQEFYIRGMTQRVLDTKENAICMTKLDENFIGLTFTFGLRSCETRVGLLSEPNSTNEYATFPGSLDKCFTGVCFRGYSSIVLQNAKW